MGALVETGGGRLNAGGITAISTTRIVRPANTTQYTAGDVLGSTVGAAPIEFAGCARFPGGSGIIQTGILIQNTFAATKLQVDLLLFDSNKVTTAVDNAAFALGDLELDTLLLSISFDGVANAKTAAAATGYIPVTGLTLPFQCAPSSTSLWGVFVVRNAYTPASRETFRIRLGILQD